MRIIGLGTDIVEIARIERSITQLGEPFLARVFTAEERAYCGHLRTAAACYAARFAVKEAVAKALGTGIGEQLAWLEITVQREPSGRPRVVLSGVGAKTAAALGVAEIHISLSHSEHYAVAQAIACGA